MLLNVVEIGDGENPKGIGSVLFDGKTKGTLQQRSIPAKPRFRSVPDVAVLNSPFVTERSLSADVFQGASYGILLCFR